LLKVDRDVLQSVCDIMPLGIVVLGEKDVVYCNREAERFVGRYRLPSEVDIVSKRIFNAIRSGTFEKIFPGEICFSKRYMDSPSTWIFRMKVTRNPHPLVSVFITEETVSNKVDLNKMRRKYRLTRRETDIVRRVLRGLRNREIADEFDVTEQTIKDHLSSIYSKLGIRNRIHLMQMIMNSSLYQ
jgi:DNA-binding NarL/FixJ family response regulator